MIIIRYKDYNSEEKRVCKYPYTLREYLADESEWLGLKYSKVVNDKSCIKTRVVKQQEKETFEVTCFEWEPRNSIDARSHLGGVF